MAEAKDTPKTAPLKTSIRRRALLYTNGVVAGTALLLTLCAFIVGGSLLSQRVSAQLSSLVASKESSIASRLQTDRERTALLSSRSEVSAAYRQHAVDPLVQLLRSLEAEGAPVSGIAVFDSRGQKIAGAGKDLGVETMLVESTTLTALMNEEGWDGHVVFSPLRGTPGVLGVRYEVREFLNSLLLAASVGQTGKVFLGREAEGRIELLNYPLAETRDIVVLGSLDDEMPYALPMAEAISGREGVRKAQDHQGKQVYTAYRSIPTLGWGLVVQVDQHEALKGILALGIALTAITFTVLLLSSIVGMSLVKRLTDPILRLSTAMGKLQPGHWKISRTVKSGDEVELLETVAVDMAHRLKRTYEFMEEEIEARTLELRTQYLKDRAILEAIEQGVLMVDRTGKVTGANPAALDVLKCPDDRCLGQDIEEALDIRLHRKQLKKSEHPVRTAMRKKETIRSTPEMRYSIMRDDNILIPVLLVIRPLIESGKVVGAVVVFQDITEERRVDYLKSEFISLASHQLRTPLSSLQWYVELFADEKGLTDGQKEYLKEMQTAASRMSNLIDALLHAARLEGGNIKPRSDSVDVTTLIANLSEELRVLAKEKNISCSVDIPHSAVHMMTDSVLLHVVFKNLFSNAVKYTPKGGQVGVSMKVAKDVEISVRDTGIGIPKAERKRLFERLFRASNVRSLDTDGNGLGLYITKMIIDSLHGTITVDSEEGKGSTFVVRLPLKPPTKRTRTLK